MASDRARQRVLTRIRKNIETAGFHLYLIADGSVPRFAYTIGLRDTIGGELVMPGAIFYMADDVARVFHAVRREVEQRGLAQREDAVAGHGGFSLRRVDSSWVPMLLLGACDYYQTDDVPAWQLVPPVERMTIDVPDMGSPWDPEREPVWRWLQEPWPHPVPDNATVTTSLAALRGQRVTEVTRWDDGWEMFPDGSDVPESALRVVPLGVFLGYDPTLEAALDVPVGEGIWRRPEGDEWHAWRRRSPT